MRRDGRIAHLPNCGAGELCGSFGRAVGASKKRFQTIAKDLRLERHAVLQTATLSQLIEAPARAKVCKGMAGLIEEGEEVIREGKRKEQTAADLALIGAAQRVEHCEMAAYTTAITWPCKCVSPRSSTFSPRRWAKNKMRANCSIR